jgi:hypothetical protein
MTPADEARFIELWAQGASYRDLAAALRCPRTYRPGGHPHVQADQYSCPPCGVRWTFDRPARRRSTLSTLSTSGVCYHRSTVSTMSTFAPARGP